ncbi:MAG: hypothetical protein PVJ34_13270, partial [Anaerolineae bacterium]
MDYGNVLNQAWEIIWKHKYLIILGLLVALTSGLGSGTSSSTNWQLDGETQAPAFGTPPGDAFQAPAIPLALGLFFGGLILLVV